MDNINSKALKSGIWYTFANFISKGTIFLTTPIFTRLLATEEVGYFSNMTSLCNTLLIITSLELSSSIILAKYDYKNDIDGFIGSIILFDLIYTSFIFALLFVFFKNFASFFSVDNYSLLVIYLYCLLYPSFDAIIKKQRVFFKYKETTALSLLSSIISTLSSLLLVILLNNKLLGRIVGYYVPLLLIYSVICIFIIKRTKNFSIAYIKYALTISIPTTINLFSGQLLNHSDTLMITKMCGLNESAQYSIIYSCSQIVSILFISMNTAFAPWSYEKMNNNEIQELRKASKPYIFVFAIIVALFILFAPEAILIVGGKKYMNAIDCMPPIMIGLIFQFIYSLYSNIEIYNKKQKYIALGTTIAATVNVLLNLYLIPKYGYKIAAYTTLIGYMCLFIIHFCFVAKLNKSHYYDTKFIFTILIISLLSIPIILFIYKYNTIRYLLIAFCILLFLAICIKNRFYISKIIKERKIEYLKEIKLFNRKK